MKRIAFVLGAVLLMSLSGNSNFFLSGSNSSAGALKAAPAPDRCAEYRANIARAERDIADLQDEIRSLQEDVLAGKNVEWALEQIERLWEEIRKLRIQIGTWQRYIDRNC